MHKNYFAASAILGGLAVAAGAFGAHGLESITKDEKILHGFRTGVEYQMYHALGILAVGLLAMHGASTAGNVAGWSFLLGTLLFSGSLYALVLTGNTKLGMITPIGGVLFIVGWVALAAAAFKATPMAKGL